MLEEMLRQLNMIPELLLAILLGFLIGFERKLRFKEAGIRTHTIVCFGAAVMMVISKHAFGSEADAARVAAQIVSGIGFLCAGMIIYKQNQVHGLTTAAGIWATAGVGMACGGGLWLLAVIVTALLIITQCVYHLEFKLFQSKKYYFIKIEFLQVGNSDTVIKGIFKTDRFNHLTIKRKNGEVYYSATLHTDIEYHSSTLNKIMEENPFILSIERCDNE